MPYLVDTSALKCFNCAGRRFRIDGAGDRQQLTCRRCGAAKMNLPSDRCVLMSDLAPKLLITLAIGAMIAVAVASFLWALTDLLQHGMNLR